MNAPSKPRDIIDRRTLLAELAELGEDAKDPRARLVDLLKRAHRAGYDEIRRRFEDGADGTQTVRAHCYLMDQLIRTLHDCVAEQIYPLANPTAGERLSIVAVGGYGRGGIAPPSDRLEERRVG